jgi:hypothetical protein
MRIFPTKTIRILSLAPDGFSAQGQTSQDPNLWENGVDFAGPSHHERYEAVRTRSLSLIQLLSMLREETGGGEDGLTDEEWEDMVEEDDHQ